MQHSYLYKARVFVYHADGSFHKMITYHNIDSRRKMAIDRFENFVLQKIKGAHHVNYYDGVYGIYQYQTRF